MDPCFLDGVLLISRLLDIGSNPDDSGIAALERKNSS